MGNCEDSEVHFVHYYLEESMGNRICKNCNDRCCFKLMDALLNIKKF